MQTALCRVQLKRSMPLKLLVAGLAFAISAIITVPAKAQATDAARGAERADLSTVGKQWILTAAHCAEAMKEVGASASCFVREGTLNLKPSDGQDSKVARIAVHSDYDPERTLNDITLLQVTTMPTQRQPLRARDRVPEVVVPRSMATVTGFGPTSIAAEEP